MVIEQDVIIHADVLPQFEACPEPWCLFPARHYATPGGWMTTGIMCNRFRREFMEAVPVEAVEAIYGSCGAVRRREPEVLGHLDGKTREAGEAAGFKIHVHWPSVGHRDSLPGEYPELRGVPLRVPRCQSAPSVLTSSPTTVSQAPTGISWANIIPGRDVSEGQRIAEMANICARATALWMQPLTSR